MAQNTDAIIRLKKELKDILSDPIPFIEALPNPSNIFEWYVVLTVTSSPLAFCNYGTSR